MRRLATFVLSCATVLAAVSMRSVLADEPMMSGGASIPKDHQYMLGTWQCTVHLPAMQGHPASVDHGTMTVSVSPMMTLHAQVVAKDYMSDSYEGYDMKTKTHWETTGDTTGQVASESSKDGKVFTGTTWSSGTATPIRDVETKVSDTQWHDVTSLQMNGTWAVLADSMCTKS